MRSDGKDTKETYLKLFRVQILAELRKTQSSRLIIAIGGPCPLFTRCSEASVVTHKGQTCGLQTAKKRSADPVPVVYVAIVRARTDDFAAQFQLQSTLA